MIEDDIILVFGYVLLAALIATLAIRIRNWRRTLVFHFTALGAYSVPLLYGLKILSKEGDALVWWFYLACAITAHLLLVATLVLRTFLAKNH